jgi:hypothetical protein
MKEDLEQILSRFDKSTIEYLEMNKGEIFISIASNKGIPETIGVTLAGMHAQREILLDAINKLDKAPK